MIVFSFGIENQGLLLAELVKERQLIWPVFPTKYCWFLQNSMIPTSVAWKDLLQPLYQKYKDRISYGDQDLLNIIFHDNPGTNIHLVLQF